MMLSESELRKELTNLESDRIERTVSYKKIKLTEKRTATAKTFDAKPCFGSSLGDLNIDILRTYLRHAIDEEILAENHRDIHQQLASLRLYDGVYNCPTNAGILLIGKNPLFFLPGAYVQYVRFNGKEMTDPVKSEKRFHGDLYTVLKGLNDFIKNVIIEQRPVKTDSMQEKAVRNYPFWALRELIMNAVMHRNYESNAPTYCYEFSDRIEIINPGGLYGEVRPENFPNASDYRNPVIAEAMKHLGYVNRFNIGIRQAQSELRKNGNRPAEFDIGLITKFSVTVFKHALFL